MVSGRVVDLVKRTFKYSNPETVEETRKTRVN